MEGQMKGVLRQSIVLMALASVAVAPARLHAQNAASSQVNSPAVQLLLVRAAQQEASGHMNLAAQNWQQVLLADPNNLQALSGLARWNRMEGNDSDAQKYIDRIRQIDPSSPLIQQLQSVVSNRARIGDLTRAAKLAQSGHPEEALKIYQRVFGNTPPDNWAQAYYDTEAAIPSKRDDAINGLRALVQRNPGNPAYAIDLGRTLTYNPSTRPEGVHMLEKYQGNPEAEAALRQALAYSVQNPSYIQSVRNYLKNHQDAQLAAELAKTEASQARASSGLARTPGEQRAYAALNANRLQEAQTRFEALYQQNPNNPRVLAGLGFLQMKANNFGGAISYFSQAEQDGLHARVIESSLATSRFWYTMQQASNALTNNQLQAAEQGYAAALEMRHNSPDALAGLAGVYMKAQEPAQAIPIYQRLLKVKGSQSLAWRGLFLAEQQSGNSSQALATNARMPASIRQSLESDPEYLQALANAYQATGQSGKAQQALASALQLPFPQNGRNMKAGTRMQYASLLAQDHRYAQAAGIYRDVLNEDPNNVSAWQGLVAMEHQTNNDAQAIAIVEQMPPPVYDQALRSPDFLSMLAAIYQQQNQLNIAQTFLQRASRIYADNGTPVPVSLEMQVAAIDLQQSRPQQAYGIYREILMRSPDNLNAWKGLLSALHQTGHDADALAQLEQIPAQVRTTLEKDTDFLQTEASIYAATGNQPAALGIIQRIARHYYSQRMLMPASMEVQQAWLLFNLKDDRDLYRTLMHLGDRADLTTEQRRTVQTIWASWSVRRASNDIKAGNTRLAIEILTSARQAFPDNPDVSKALAGGYLQAGQPKQALAIYESLNTNNNSADDYASMVGAALAAQNTKLAEMWLREALQRYPNAPSVLSAAARFEQARGDNQRAADYWRASLHAMPQVSPTTELAHKLDQPDAMRPGRPVQQTNLVNLLNPDANLMAQQQPYVPLPGYRKPEVYSPGVQQANNEPYGPDPYYQGTAPVVIGNQQIAQEAAPSYVHSQLPPATQVLAQSDRRVVHHHYYRRRIVKKTAPVQHTAHVVHHYRRRRRVRPKRYTGETLGQYQPQSSVPAPQPWSYPPSNNPQPQQSYPAQQQGYPAQPQPGYGTPVPQQNYGYPQSQQNYNQSLPSGAQPSYQQNANPSQYAPIRPQDNNSNAYPSGSPGGYGQGGDGSGNGNASMSSGAVIGGSSDGSDSDGSGAQLHLSISSGPVIQPQLQQPDASLAQMPVHQLTLDTSESIRDIQNAQRRQEAMLRAQQELTEAAHPQNEGLISTQYSSPQPQGYLPAPQQQVRPAPPQTYYMQPVSPFASSNQGSYQVAQGQQTNQQVAPPPYGYQPQYQYQQQQQQQQPAPPPPSQNGASNQQLEQENLPPLTGPYVHAPRSKRLDPRQAAEEQLASIEGGYSGWLGGTGYLSHRSGNLGYDALSAFEAPLEASTPIGYAARLTLVVDPVFLDSGQATKVPVIGSTGQSELLGSEITAPTTPPTQQNSAGAGGELQVTTNTFGVAIGSTPYGFLVQNIIGQFQWKPANGPFTFSFNRSPVTDSQLSYSGLRDPASITNVYTGNIWGGVISNAFQVQFGRGGASSGSYISAGGQYLTGTHVETNTRFDGDAGAYWRVWSVPDTGNLTLGVNLFGMHYAHNLQYFTYGQGGYFSPQAYMLANVPFTWQGEHGLNWHYQVAGAFGVQAFQQDSSPYYPLDPLLETASSNLSYPAQTIVGSNYDLHAEASYHLNDHWYLGGFTSLNNTRDYNNQTIGFFVRFLFRPQNPTELGPTGLFPWSGLRPHMVP
uniref:Tetratricopeptide repeat protein n=1 Tax=Acidobacterium capsulatum TaxID=33075 RepID=A0A7V4XV44_9BACT